MNTKENHNILRRGEQTANTEKHVYVLGRLFSRSVVNPILICVPTADDSTLFTLSVVAYFLFLCLVFIGALWDVLAYLFIKIVSDVIHAFVLVIKSMVG